MPVYGRQTGMVLCAGLTVLLGFVPAWGRGAECDFSAGGAVYSMTEEAVDDLAGIHELFMTVGACKDITSLVRVSEMPAGRLELTVPVRAGGVWEEHTFIIGKDTEEQGDKGFMYEQVQVHEDRFIAVYDSACSFYVQIRLRKTGAGWSVCSARHVMSGSVEIFAWGMLDTKTREVVGFILPEYSRILAVADEKLKAVDMSSLKWAVKEEYNSLTQRDYLERQASLITGFLTNCLNSPGGSLSLLKKDTGLYLRGKVFNQSLSMPFHAVINPPGIMFTRESYLRIRGDAMASAGDDALSGRLDSMPARELTSLRLKRNWHVVSTSHTSMPSAFFTDYVKQIEEVSNGRLKMFSVHLHPYGEQPSVNGVSLRNTILSFLNKALMRVGRLNFCPSLPDIEFFQGSGAPFNAIISRDSDTGMYGMIFYGKSRHIKEVVIAMHEAVRAQDFAVFGKLLMSITRRRKVYHFLSEDSFEYKASRDRRKARLREAARRVVTRACERYYFIRLTEVSAERLIEDCALNSRYRIRTDSTGAWYLVRVEDGFETQIFNTGGMPTVIGAACRIRALLSDKGPADRYLFSRAFEESMLDSMLGINDPEIRAFLRYIWAEAVLSTEQAEKNISWAHVRNSVFEEIALESDTVIYDCVSAVLGDTTVSGREEIMRKVQDAVIRELFEK